MPSVGSATIQREKAKPQFALKKLVLQVYNKWKKTKGQIIFIIFKYEPKRLLVTYIERYKNVGFC